MNNCSTHHIHKHHSCSHGANHACEAAPKNTMMDKVVDVLEKVSLVAIAVFSAMVSPLYFGISFAAGFILGAWQGLSGNVEEAPNQEHATCGHSLVERLFKVRFPRPVGLLADVAIFAVHLDHHAAVFVPIVGGALGMLAGNAAAPALDIAYHKIDAYVKKPHWPTFCRPRAKLA